IDLNMSSRHNRIKQIYTPLPLLRIRTKLAKSYKSFLPITYKLSANKLNEFLNLSNSEKSSEHSNDLSNLERYSNESNELDIDWENNQEEQLLDNIDWKNNKTEYLHDYITLDNLEDYEKYLQDNDNDLMNSDNNTKQNTQKYKLFKSQSQSFEEFNRKYTAYEDLVKILKHSDFQPEHVIANIRSSTKSAYSIMLVDYIEYILNNLTIVPNLYFGPGIVCDEK
ncbi:15966_t:CDS:2, partial [Racocetra persica]